VNSTMIYCKNFCKYHNVPQVQQEFDNKRMFKWEKKETSQFQKQ
jgi:hypothetical protein